jgi:hypothetical protein
MWRRSSAIPAELGDAEISFTLRAAADYSSYRELAIIRARLGDQDW